MVKAADSESGECGLYPESCAWLDLGTLVLQVTSDFFSIKIKAVIILLP